MKARAPLLLLVAIALVGGGVPSADAAARGSRFVRVDGKRFVDPEGRPLLLRGINLGNWLLPEGYMFGFENRARHRAGGDAEVTALLLERLLGLARGEGAMTLADIEAIETRRRRRPRKKRTSLPTSTH